MDILKVSFDMLEDGAKIPVGYNKAFGQLVFDARMTFELKSRSVKCGHRTPDPEWLTFSGVVSRESARIALTYFVLNDLHACAYEIQNACL